MWQNASIALIINEMRCHILSCPPLQRKKIIKVLLYGYKRCSSLCSLLNSTCFSVKAEGIRALKEYAEEIVRGMPPFEPGRQSGSAVRTKVTLPITFKLN